MNVLEVDLHKLTVSDPFLGQYQQLVRDVVIPYQWDALNDRIPEAEPSHAIENFRIAAGQQTGDFYGMVFQDSDVAKWLEAVAWSLCQKPDPALEKTADEVIELVAAACMAIRWRVTSPVRSLFSAGRWSIALSRPITAKNCIIRGYQKRVNSGSLRAKGFLRIRC